MAREAVCDELYAERVLIGIHFKIHALKAFEALVRADERDRLATAIDAMPFGDTAASFAVWIRNGGRHDT
jgi:hypothetical protein